MLDSEFILTFISYYHISILELPVLQSSGSFHADKCHIYHAKHAMSSVCVWCYTAAKKRPLQKKKNSLESSRPFLRLLLLSALPGKDTIAEENKQNNRKTRKIKKTNRKSKKIKNLAGCVSAGGPSSTRAGLSSPPSTTWQSSDEASFFGKCWRKGRMWNIGQS